MAAVSHTPVAHPGCGREDGDGKAQRVGAPARPPTQTWLSSAASVPARETKRTSLGSIVWDDGQWQGGGTRLAGARGPRPADGELLDAPQGRTAPTQRAARGPCACRLPGHGAHLRAAARRVSRRVSVFHASRHAARTHVTPETVTVRATESRETRREDVRPDRPHTTTGPNEISQRRRGASVKPQRAVSTRLYGISAL